MLSGDPPRTRAGERVLERLRLAYPGKGLTQGGLDKLQYARSGSSVGLDPKSQILAELGMELGFQGAPLPLF